MENLIYKKIMLIITLAKSLKDYRAEPIKIMNRIVNDSKNELGADVNVGANIITGMNSAITRDHAINKGKIYILDILNNNTEELKNLILKDLQTIDKYVVEINNELIASKDTFLKSNAKIKINQAYSNTEKSQYFLLRLERDFINKLSSYAIGLNVSINMNKLLIVIRKALSTICKFNPEDIEALKANTVNLKEFLTNRELNKRNVLDDDFLAEQLNYLSKSENKLENLPINNYKKIGEIIRDVALQCPELETETIDIRECILTLDTFLNKTSEHIELIQQKFTELRNAYNEISNVSIPNISKDINETFDKYLNYNITDEEYTNVILNNILTLVNVVALDREVRMEIFELLKIHNTHVNIYLAMQNLYLYMSTYGLETKEE